MLFRSCIYIKLYAILSVTMPKTQLSGDDFISSVFKPNVVISSSADANLLCVKNHLTFTDLLKPFSAVNKDGIS